MAKILTESLARTFISNYSAFSVSSVTADTNRLITVNRVLAMGGRVVGDTTGSKLVDADHLVGYQLPSDKLNKYDFYFASNGGCNLALTLSRRLYSESSYSGINGGNHPSLTFVKNPDTSSTDGNIGRLLWDQLDVANKMTITWNNSTATNAPRSYLLNMSLNSTTYGADNKYYYIGQVVIQCGQVGAKPIMLYYKKYKAVTNSMYFTIFINNNMGRTMTYVNVTYKITGTGYTTVTDSFTINSMSVGETHNRIVTHSGFVSGRTYTITITNVNASGGYSNTATVSNSNCPYPQSGSNSVTKNLA